MNAGKGLKATPTTRTVTLPLRLLQKARHGVFYGDSFTTTNKAWMNRNTGFKIVSEDADKYFIPYANAGYAGGYAGQGQNLDWITIVTEEGLNKIITSYPGI